MNSDTGGLTPSERQRQTAAEIARKKVLAAYSNAKNPPSDNLRAMQNSQSAPGDQAATTPTSLKSTPTNPGVTREEWQKYHSAWQNYYQKYYSQYYSTAARNYVAKEKLRVHRAAEEQRRLLESSGLQPAQPVEEPVENLNKNFVQSNSRTGVIASTPAESPEEVKTDFRQRLRERAARQVKASHRHKRLVPILAGVGVILVFLFLQYNRLIFAPIVAYVSPGNSDDSSNITPVDPSITQSVGPENKLIIPKLNVNVPVHFGISNDTQTVMSAMNNGVAQFVIPGASANPGENGNVVITGHSAGDIYSSNQYKFIFSGLERLGEGDLIYVNYNSTRYTYTVNHNQTVDPSDVAALTQATGQPQLILVTCTPLGTSRYRLLVFADQINPVPDGAAQPATSTESTPSTSEDTSMPANEDTFFEGIWKFLTGQS